MIPFVFLTFALIYWGYGLSQFFASYDAAYLAEYYASI